MCSGTINRKYLSHIFLCLALLQNPDVLHKVDNLFHSNSDVLRDVLDSEYVKNHPIFAIQKDALFILGYFDDLEIANPLGSKPNYYTRWISTLKRVSLQCYCLFV